MSASVENSSPPTHTKQPNTNQRNGKLRYLLVAVVGAAIGGVVVMLATGTSTPTSVAAVAPTSAVPAPAIESASSAASNQNAMAAMPGSKAGSIDDLVEGLRARLEREPGDMNGWVLLGRSYHFLQRWPEATAAFDKARALGWKEEMPALDGAAPAASAMPNPVFLGVQDAVQRQSEQLQAKP